MIAAFVTCLILSGPVADGTSSHVCLEGTPRKSRIDCRNTAVAQEELRRKNPEMAQVEGYYCREIRLFARPDNAYWSEDETQYEPRRVMLACAVLLDHTVECIPVKMNGEYVTEMAECNEQIDWFYETIRFDAKARTEVQAWFCKEGKTFSESNESAYQESLNR